ncbi:MAG: APC family permease [Gammaproteobacteria bacterium]|nr:APC family permease [Gammaproteobacteria bacterium]MCH9743375.1 APC family permease [Gammaproteobacteria bacterium]
MITVGSVDSIRNLPTTALFGSHLIFYFVLAAIFFFLPTALISAELVSYDETHGGVYKWVRHAFSERMGFLAIWFQWTENVIWYPTILSFVAGTLAYVISPHLAQNKWFLVAVILVSFWGLTILNLLGIKTSAIFANICALAGLLIPMIFIIALGVVWIVQGDPLQISFHASALIPHYHGGNDVWIALTAVMMSFAGVEIATVHADDVKNPQKTYPRALLISTIILVITLVLGSLAIAISVPTHEISLVSGVMQTFGVFFDKFHLHALLWVMGVILVIGGLGGVNNWVIAPTRGLYYAACDGSLPKIFQKTNQHGAPVALLLFQVVLVTIIALVFLLLPTVNAAYLLLTAMAAQQYILMYVLMFLAGIKLRYAKFNNHGFRITPYRWGTALVAIAGIVGSVIVFVIGFIPPTFTNIGSIPRYELTLGVGFIALCVIPFVLYHFCQRRS